MRKIGGDLSKDHATRVADYLLTQGIDSVVEVVADGHCELWARQEDQLVEAKQHLRGFLAEPDSERFRVNREAETLRRTREKENREKLRLQQKFQPRATSIAAGSNRATFAIIALCVVASLATNFGNERPRSMQGDVRQPSLQWRIYNAMTLLPVTAMNSDETSGPMDAVKKGQVWRLITPIFLHGDPMHLVFNALFLFSFGRIVETICGPKFLIGLFLIGGIVGVVAQAYGPMSLGGNPHVIGASGGALALFSFLWLRPNFEPSIPFRIPPFTLFLVMGFVVLSMLPMAPIRNVANLAHLGGLAWGAAVATGWLDFLRR